LLINRNCNLTGAKAIGSQNKNNKLDCKHKILIENIIDKKPSQQRGVGQNINADQAANQVEILML
jgi:hypothetical protein